MVGLTSVGAAQQREARLRAECQQLQRRWQKLEEQHRAGEIPDIDPEAIAVRPPPGSPERCDLSVADVIILFFSFPLLTLL